MSSPKLLFFGPIGKPRWPPWLFIGRYFFNWSSETYKGMHRNLTESKTLMSSTKFVFFWLIVNQGGRTDLSDLLSHFRFLLWNAKRNSSKLDRRHDPYVLYQVCVFSDDLRTKIAALACDWLRHFQFLLWNCRTEYNDTKPDASSQFPLPSVCFRVDRKTKMATLASDLMSHFLLLWNC